MRTLLIAVAFVLSIFAAQLVRIQGFDASAVAAEARKQRTATVAIPALRGQILSSDGVVLAASQERITVVADLTAICTYQTKKNKCDDASSGEAVGKAAAALAPLLGQDEAKLRENLTGTARYRILERQATPLTWRKIADLRIPGIYKDQTPGADVSVPQRTYPTGPAAASLVGFVTNDGKAGGGVEQLMDATLQGTVGQVEYETSATGEVIPAAGQTRKEAVNGTDVRLTINSGLQWYAQNALAQKMEQTNALSGTVVAMNAKTGDLLAVASYPTYDPNDIGRANGSLTNKAFGEVFEPGSTAKLMTIAAAMQDGTVTPDTPVIVPPTLPRYDQVFNDSHAHPTEYRTVTGVLAESSNIGTVLVSETLTPKRLEEYFRKFGLGTKSGTGFPGESAGLLTKSEDWSGTQRATVAFGQGLSVTAIQAAGVFQTIANNGVRVEPRLIESTTDKDGTVKQTPASKGSRVVDEKVAKQVSEMLEGVVSPNGTAPQAQIAGYRVAGKTGTADRYDPTVGGYSGKTASFIGYAPADDPQIVVAVILQRPTNGYFGGSTAGPVFHDVMTYALQELKIPPTGTAAPQLVLDVEPSAAEADPTTLRNKPKGSGG
ncbi:putative cell division protein FtsI/penicillin-binding protein [Phycicoccus elongatus Lp2]|uniref:Putative cell division protein FtsI/penicillin-binding protein n=1 Tax=Phycicoccus elongatus Lp2 TaxID=1193181 RepID=N0E1R9_9MICO|nr:penicillin-binding protein 2 [Phycicoccus elongatus]CCH69706.1 putative cell division protein FtsI/penicillin-binding protein [Phycicoccus elongatus Lp2]